MRTRSMRYGSVESLSAEEELELAQSILRYQGLDDPSSQDPDRSMGKERDRAVNLLVESYSPLIERIAREHYTSAGPYGGTWEDFLSEAYLVAVQCANSFDPTKGQTQIRFSSYVSRAISSTLLRMSMRSRSVVSVPVTVMTAARRWSHTRYEAMNRGLEISDEDVSALSGVDMTQSVVRDVLGLGGDASVDDINPPVFDSVSLDDSDKLTEQIRQAIEDVLPDQADKILLMLGLTTGTAITTAFRISNEGGYKMGDSRSFLRSFPGLIHHPTVRIAIARQLNGDTPPDNRKDNHE